MLCSTNPVISTKKPLIAIAGNQRVPTKRHSYQNWLRRYAKFSARSFAPDEGESDCVFDQAYSHLKPAKNEAPWFP